MQREVERLRSFSLFLNTATEGSKGFSFEADEIHLWSGLFRALPFDPKVVEAVGELASGALVLHLASCFYKPARSGVGTRWHADRPVLDGPGRVPSLDGKAVVMWIAVHDVTADNGALQLIPRACGSPQRYADNPDSTYRPMALLSDEQQRAAHTILVPAGGAVFFSYDTLHCTLDNTSAHDRAAVTYHFLCADRFAPGFPPDHLFHPLVHPHLSGPFADGGARELGVSQLGRWSEEVSLALSRSVPEVSEESVYSYARPVELRLHTKVGDDRERLTRASLRIETGLAIEAEIELLRADYRLIRILDGEACYGDLLEEIEEETGRVGSVAARARDPRRGEPLSRPAAEPVESVGGSDDA